MFELSDIDSEEDSDMFGPEFEQMFHNYFQSAPPGTEEIIEDNPDVQPSSLRFEIGNPVIYKSEDNCWYEGEVIEVAKRVRYDGPYPCLPIAYAVLPIHGVEDPEWVMEDNDDFIRPRYKDLTPDPEKCKPFLAVPEDPLHHLYTSTNKEEYTTEDGSNIVDDFEKLNLQGRVNPDGTMNTFKMRPDPVNEEGNICGVDAPLAMMFVTNDISLRESIYSKYSDSVDMAKTFKSIMPSESSLQDLERAAKKSNRKMLQLADALMVGLHGWEIDEVRARQLYRAAACGLLSSSHHN